MRVQADLTFDSNAISGIVEQFQAVLERTVAAQMESLRADLERSDQAPEPQPTKIPQGVSLPESERLKAADLRTALLLGKVPDDAGLLIDVHMVAKLLSVSARTVARLQDLKAIPQSVKLGTLVRWKLTELIEWLDCGCPSRWQKSNNRKKGS